MRISTITNWAYGVTLLLTGLSGAAFLLSARAADSERAAVVERLAFDDAADDLAVGSERLTNAARLYAVRGDARDLEMFRREAGEVRTRDRALERARRLDAAPIERAALDAAEAGVADVDGMEADAVALAARGDRAAAQAVLYGPDHERAQAAVLNDLDRFRDLVTARTQGEVRRTQAESDQAMLAAKVMLALTALVFLAVLYFVLRRRVAVPLVRMTGIVLRLARQDYAVDVPEPRRSDEIGDMTRAIQVFRDNGLERDRLEAQRAADQRAKDGILQMMQRLQACQTSEELAEVVACFAPQTFPDLSGALYVLNEDRNALTRAGSWLEPEAAPAAFAPSACWGVRRGRTHVSDGRGDDVCCPHVEDPTCATLCVPLTAQGDTIGLLYFERRRDRLGPAASDRIYLDLIADNIALSLANLRLRERLSNLAVRDALTGLNNRRSLDEALNLHARDDEPVAGVMIDIDHFKRFNDQFGHDAGDAVMQHVAQILREGVGDAGRAYRFGGEEFAVLLPGADIDAAFQLAERLRAQVAACPLAHHGRMLGHITISLGVAAAPDDGPAANLLRRADAALLQAKADGRDRTVRAADATPGETRSAA